jgi:hypothetical protein
LPFRSDIKAIFPLGEGIGVVLGKGVDLAVEVGRAVGQNEAEGVVLALGVRVGLGLDVGAGLEVVVGVTLGVVEVADGLTEPEDVAPGGVGELELLEVVKPLFLGGNSYPHEINNVKTREAI